MNDLLNNPAIQAGVAPFAVALVVALLLRNTRFAGLAILAGFAVVVGLVMGYSFESLTSARKAVLLGLAAGVLVLPLELAGIKPRLSVLAALGLGFGLAALWVVQRLLQQMESGAMVSAVATVLFVAALVASGISAPRDPVRGGAAMLMLGLASGALALLGASAMLAQFGIAIGASAGGVLLVQMIFGRPAPSGWTLALPASVTAAMLGILSVYTGSLPWYCLMPLVAVPWAVRIVPAGPRAVWLDAVFCAIAALVPALLAVVLAWATAGAPAA